MSFRIKLEIRIRLGRGLDYAWDYGLAWDEVRIRSRLIQKVKFPEPLLAYGF